MSTDKPSAVFLTREQMQAMQDELFQKVGNALDGHPSVVNLSVLIQMLFVVAEDCGMDANKLLDIVAANAHIYFNEPMEGTKQ
jgi:thymidylate synthase